MSLVLDRTPANPDLNTLLFRRPRIGDTPAYWLRFDVAYDETCPFAVAPTVQTKRRDLPELQPRWFEPGYDDDLGEHVAAVDVLLPGGDHVLIRWCPKDRFDTPHRYRISVFIDAPASVEVMRAELVWRAGLGQHYWQWMQGKPAPVDPQEPQWQRAAG